MSDGVLYKQIAAELTANKPDPALWTQAFAEALGDPEKTKALYIRLRLASLKPATISSQVRPVAPPNAIAQAPVDSELALLRLVLAKQLAERNATSFYSTLGISPAADDQAVTDAILALELQIDRGEAASSPEFRYARETLANPKTREAYDRRLSGLYSSPRTGDGRVPQHPEFNVESESVFLNWWGSSKTTVMIATLLLVVVGYLFQGYLRERNNVEVRKDQIAVARDVTHLIVNNEKASLERAAELERKNLELREQAEARRQQSIDIERSRQQSAQYERERREAERLKLAEQKEEERKAERERRYWTCVNQAMSNRMNSADANARCASYRG